MPTQKSIANKNRKFVSLTNKDWSFYVFYLKDIKTLKSGPWSEPIATSLRNDLLVNGICAWIKRLDEDK
jgi:hypothetical protein